MKAAILTGIGEPFEIADVELQAPKEREVKIKLAASGVCHSDLSVQNGTLPLPMPIVCGHEGAGVVTEVGPGVTHVAPGDHVVISWVPQCGRCYNCSNGQPELCEVGMIGQASGGLLDGTSRFTRDGSPVFQMSTVGTFAEETVIPAMGAVKIDSDIPLDKAALIGCGVLTGVGAAINTAAVKPGDTVAVVGCGGVGLNVIQGAKIAGASQIIAVDKVPLKLDLAKEFGATDVVDASDGDPVSAVKDLTPPTPLGPRGVDIAFEVIGFSTTMQQALGMARRGGKMVIVGVPRMDDMWTSSPFADYFIGVKTVIGCMYGSANVFRDVPRMASLYKQGVLKLDELVSRTIALDDVNGAFEAMEKGEVARSVIVYE
jgi:S-(hydroxymethyl)glutathione dehydrogenase/alcohol dehydrogenase